MARAFVLMVAVCFLLSRDIALAAEPAGSTEEIVGHILQPQKLEPTDAKIATLKLPSGRSAAFIRLLVHLLVQLT